MINRTCICIHGRWSRIAISIEIIIMFRFGWLLCACVNSWHALAKLLLSNQFFCFRKNSAQFGDHVHAHQIQFRLKFPINSSDS